MRTVMIVGTVLLLLPCMASAQYAEDEMGGEWRIGAGWVDNGSLDDGFGVGIDYIHHFGANGVMASFEWADVNAYAPSKGMTKLSNRFSVALGFLRSLPRRAGSQPYFGAAALYTTVENGVDDDCIGARVFGGATLGSGQRWYLQAGYDFGTDLFGGADVDGPRITAGLSF